MRLDTIVGLLCMVLMFAVVAGFAIWGFTGGFF